MILHPTGRAQAPSPDSVRTYLPQSLDLAPFLPEKWRDYGRFAVGGLYLRHHLEKQREDDDFRPLSSVALKEVLPKRNYKDILDGLKAGGIIEDQLNERGRERYCAGRESKGYRLTAAYRDDRFRAEWLTHHELVRKVRVRREREKARHPAELHRHLREMFAHLGVTDDFPKVSLPMTCIADREFFFEICPQGRVHTNLTNLGRNLREFIRHDGRPLWMVDIANSQPLIMALTLRSEAKMPNDFLSYRGKTPPSSHQIPPTPPSTTSLPYVGTYWDTHQNVPNKFLELCLEGRFYEYLMPLTGYDRATVKERFFAVAYGKPWQAAKSKVGQVFAAEFPAEWAKIRAINAKDHGSLARHMQTVESYLCVWRTCGALMREFPSAPLYTLHDCLVTDHEHIDSFATRLRAEFRAVFGVEPKLAQKPF